MAIFHSSFGSNSTIHSMPYLSLNIPVGVPGSLSPIGPSRSPTADSSLNTCSVSPRRSASMAIFDQFSFSFVLSRTSFAITELALPAIGDQV